jgi:hypothetical protein
MTTALALLLLYGAIVISSAFLIGSMGRLAAKELGRVGGRAAVRSIYFWLALNLAVQGAALVVICGLRTVDAFRGIFAAGGWDGWMVLGFTLLLLSKMGFNWAGTLALRHGTVVWWGYIVTLAAWVAAILTWHFLS